jgi:hypothetical protein
MSDQATRRLLVSIEARTRDFERAIQRAERQNRTSTRRIQQDGRQHLNAYQAAWQRAGATVQTQAAVISRALMASAFGGVGGAAFVRHARSVVSELSATAKAMDRIGVSARVFQELQFGFSQAGVEAATFQRGMETFAQKVGEAATRGGQLYEILKANGVALRDQNGNMRSQEYMLRRYADLIKRAGSEQEQLVLATVAFGDRAGREFVSALRNGEDAIDDMAKATEEAGGTIEEELLRRAEELDDKFGAMWRRFSVNSKTAIMTAITAIDDLLSKADELANHSFWRRLAAGMPTFGGAELTWLDPDLARAHGQPLGPDARIRDAFREGAEQALSAADQELIDELKKRYGNVTQDAATTVIPGRSTGGGRTGAARGANREAAAVQRLIEALEHERQLIGMTELEKARANALRQAGAAATEEQRRQILALVDDIYAQTKAEEEAAQAALDRQAAAEEMIRTISSSFGDAFVDVFRGGIESFDDFLDHVTKGLAGLAENNIRNLFDPSSAVWGKAVTATDAALDPTKAIERGAEKGTRRGGLMGIIDGFTALFGGEGFQGGAGGMGGLNGMASAGFSGFGLGYQAQNPLMGAIGGAMSGFSAGAAMGSFGGPLGAIAGDLKPVQGGLFPRPEEEKKAA